MEKLSEHSRTVAKGSFWSLLGSIFFKLSSFIYVIVLARVASQDDVGVFYLALSIMSIINAFGDLGVSGAFIRYVPYFEGKNQRGKIKDLMKLSYPYITLLSIVIVAILIWQADAIGAFYKSPALPGAVRVLSFYILFGNIFRLNYLYMQGTGDIRNSQLYQNMQNLLKLAFTLVLFYFFGASPSIISFGFILSFLAALLISSPTVIRDVSSIKENETLSHKELFGEVIPLGVLVAVLQYFSIIIASSDRLILGYLIEPGKASSVIAVYSFATTLATVLLVFPGAIGNIFLPVVSRLAGKGDMESMREVMSTSQRWSLFITLPIAVVMIAFSGDMMHVFYGSQYESGGLVMAIFTFGMLFSCISYTVSLALAAMRLVNIELLIAAIGAVVNAALNFALIPVFGMEGAAIASMLGFILTSILLLHFGQKLLGFRQPADVYKLFLAAGLSFVVVFLLKPYASSALLLIPIQSADPSAYLPKVAYLISLGLMICLAGVLFAISSLLLKCLKHEDIELMESAMNRAKVPQRLISLSVRLASYGVAQPKHP